MKVWILLEDDYEGSLIEAVYATKELAEAAKISKRRPGWWHVEEHEVQEQ